MPNSENNTDQSLIEWVNTFGVDYRCANFTELKSGVQIAKILKLIYPNHAPFANLESSLGSDALETIYRALHNFYKDVLHKPLVNNQLFEANGQIASSTGSNNNGTNTEDSSEVNIYLIMELVFALAMLSEDKASYMHSISKIANKDAKVAVRNVVDSVQEKIQNKTLFTDDDTKNRKIIAENEPTVNSINNNHDNNNNDNSDGNSSISVAVSSTDISQDSVTDTKSDAKSNHTVVETEPSIAETAVPEPLVSIASLPAAPTLTLMNPDVLPCTDIMQPDVLAAATQSETKAETPTEKPSEPIVVEDVVTATEQNQTISEPTVDQPTTEESIIAVAFESTIQPVVLDTFQPEPPAAAAAAVLDTIAEIVKDAVPADVESEPAAAEVVMDAVPAIETELAGTAELDDTGAIILVVKPEAGHIEHAVITELAKTSTEEPVAEKSIELSANTGEETSEEIADVVAEIGTEQKSDVRLVPDEVAEIGTEQKTDALLVPGSLVSESMKRANRPDSPAEQAADDNTAENDSEVPVIVTSVDREKHTTAATSELEINQSLSTAIVATVETETLIAVEGVATVEEASVLTSNAANSADLVNSTITTPATNSNTSNISIILADVELNVPGSLVSESMKRVNRPDSPSVTPPNVPTLPAGLVVSDVTAEVPVIVTSDLSDQNQIAVPQLLEEKTEIFTSDVTNNVDVLDVPGSLISESMKKVNRSDSPLVSAVVADEATAELPIIRTSERGTLSTVAANLDVLTVPGSLVSESMKRANRSDSPVPSTTVTNETSAEVPMIAITENRTATSTSSLDVLAVPGSLISESMKKVNRYDSPVVSAVVADEAKAEVPVVATSEEDKATTSLEVFSVPGSLISESMKRVNRSDSPVPSATTNSPIITSDVPTSSTSSSNNNAVSAPVAVGSTVSDDLVGELPPKTDSPLTIGSHKISLLSDTLHSNTNISPLTLINTNISNNNGINSATNSVTNSPIDPNIRNSPIIAHNKPGSVRTSIRKSFVGGTGAAGHGQTPVSTPMTGTSRKVRSVSFAPVTPQSFLIIPNKDDAKVLSRDNSNNGTITGTNNNNSSSTGGISISTEGDMNSATTALANAYKVFMESNGNVVPDVSAAASTLSNSSIGGNSSNNSSNSGSSSGGVTLSANERLQQIINAPIIPLDIIINTTTNNNTIALSPIKIKTETAVEKLTNKNIKLATDLNTEANNTPVKPDLNTINNILKQEMLTLAQLEAQRLEQEQQQLTDHNNNTNENTNNESAEEGYYELPPLLSPVQQVVMSPTQEDTIYGDIVIVTDDINNDSNSTSIGNNDNSTDNINSNNSGKNNSNKIDNNSEPQIASNVNTSDVPNTETFISDLTISTIDSTVDSATTIDAVNIYNSHNNNNSNNNSISISTTAAPVAQVSDKPQQEISTDDHTSVPVLNVTETPPTATTTAPATTDSTTDDHAIDIKPEPSEGVDVWEKGISNVVSSFLPFSQTGARGESAFSSNSNNNNINNNNSNKQSQKKHTTSNHNMDLTIPTYNEIHNSDKFIQSTDSTDNAHPDKSTSDDSQKASQPAPKSPHAQNSLHNTRASMPSFLPSDIDTLLLANKSEKPFLSLDDHLAKTPVHHPAMLAHSKSAPKGLSASTTTSDEFSVDPMHKHFGLNHVGMSESALNIKGIFGDSLNNSADSYDDGDETDEKNSELLQNTLGNSSFDLNELVARETAMVLSEHLAKVAADQQQKHQQQQEEQREQTAENENETKVTDLFPVSSTSASTVENAESPRESTASNNNNNNKKDKKELVIDTIHSSITPSLETTPLPTTTTNVDSVVLTAPLSQDKNNSTPAATDIVTATTTVTDNNSATTSTIATNDITTTNSAQDTTIKPSTSNDALNTLNTLAHAKPLQTSFSDVATVVIRKSIISVKGHSTLAAVLPNPLKQLRQSIAEGSEGNSGENSAGNSGSNSNVQSSTTTLANTPSGTGSAANTFKETDVPSPTATATTTTTTTAENKTENKAPSAENTPKTETPKTETPKVAAPRNRKKSLAMLLAGPMKTISDSQSKKGEGHVPVESLRTKMFQEAKRRAQDVASKLAKQKEDQQMLIEEAKAKAAQEQKRKLELKAMNDEIIARKGKAKGYGFVSIKAGLRMKEYADTLKKSPWVKQEIPLELLEWRERENSLINSINDNVILRRTSLLDTGIKRPSTAPNPTITQNNISITTALQHAVNAVGNLSDTRASTLSNATNTTNTYTAITATTTGTNVATITTNTASNVIDSNANTHSSDSAANTATNNAVNIVHRDTITPLPSATNSPATGSNTTQRKRPTLAPLKTESSFKAPALSRSNSRQASIKDLYYSTTSTSINSPVHRRTIDMIQSDKILADKFKWAKKVAKGGSDSTSDLFASLNKQTSNSSMNADNHSESEAREFSETLPRINKPKTPGGGRNTKFGGPMNTLGNQSTAALLFEGSMASNKSEKSVHISQVSSSKIREAHQFAELVKLRHPSPELRHHSNDNNNDSNNSVSPVHHENSWFDNNSNNNDTNNKNTTIATTTTNININNISTLPNVHRTNSTNNVDLNGNVTIKSLLKERPATAPNYKIVSLVENNASSLLYKEENEDAEDEQVDNSLAAIELQKDVTIYNSLMSNNGSLVFQDSSKVLTWHDANIQQANSRKIQSAGSISAPPPHVPFFSPDHPPGSPKAIVAARKFYANHQIGVGKMLNAYRPWSSPPKKTMHKTPSVHDNLAFLAEQDMEHTQQNTLQNSRFGTENLTFGAENTEFLHGRMLEENSQELFTSPDATSTVLHSDHNQPQSNHIRPHTFPNLSPNKHTRTTMSHNSSEKLRFGSSMDQMSNSLTNYSQNSRFNHQKPRLPLMINLVKLNPNAEDDGESQEGDE